MSAQLTDVVPGFADPVLAGQRVFRDCLDVLAHPGRIRTVDPDGASLPQLHAAAGALLLALLDQDTRLWLSPALARGAAARSLQFHTGCAFSDTPGEAHFALIAGPDEMPALDEFSLGSDEYPDRSTTLILQVPALLQSGWRVSGPGVRGEMRLSAPPLGAEFLRQWQQNGARLPRGVDLFITSGQRLCALPRTARLEA